jgi:hypothetical protein
MHLYLISLLFLLLYKDANSVHAASLAVEGEGAIPGYPSTIYIAHNYRPICGTLAVGSYNGDLNVGEACLPAVGQYRLTNDTFSLYTVTGIRLSDTQPIGIDTDLCMCFSLADINNRKADLCVYVSKDGATSDIQHMFDQIAYATSNYKLGRKALPGCFDIDTSSVISSLDAAGDATHVQVLPTPTSTSHTSTTPASTVSTTASSSSSSNAIPQTTPSQELPPSSASPPNTNVSWHTSATPVLLFISF